MADSFVLGAVPGFVWIDFRLSSSFSLSLLRSDELGYPIALITLRARAVVDIPDGTGAAPITGAPAACSFDIPHAEPRGTTWLSARVHHRNDPVLDWRVAGVTEYLVFDRNTTAG